jgi:nucleotide-binding universal stress UspA family protein
MFEIRTILHPTNFSERSDWAFRLACSLARDRDARLVVLHVAPPPISGMIVAQQREYDRLWDDLHRLQPPYPEVELERLLRQGNAVEEILRVAHQIECDLIVMGTHGRTGLRRLLLGSVAEQVVRQAACPVHTMKGPFSETTSVLQPPIALGARAAARYVEERV